MFKQIAAALMFLLLAGRLGAEDSFVGVYVMSHGTTMVDDQVIGFVPRSELRFDISVANEEGSAELFADGGMVELLAIELRRDGGSFEMKALNQSWKAEDQRYSFFGGLPPEPGQAGILEPGVGLKQQLVIRPPGGETFKAGHYELSVALVPGVLRRADGSPWSGRGGRAGVRFELRDASTAEEIQLKLKLFGEEALMQQDFERAALHFQEMVELDATSTDGWAGLGVAYHSAGDHQRTVECLERVMPLLRRQQLDSTLPILLADSHLRLGNTDAAIAALSIVVAEAQIEEVLDDLKRRAKQDGSSEP